MTKKELLHGILLLKKSIPKLEIDEQSAFFILEDLKVEDFMFAIKDIIRDKDFKLYDNVLGQIWYRATNKIKSAEEAWEIVIQQITQEGWNVKPEFDDPKIMRAINANGGWEKICKGEITWERKIFMATYNDFKDSESALIRQDLIPNKNEIKNIEDKDKIENLTKDIGIK